MDIIEKMQNDFRGVLGTDIPGQNWNGIRFYSYGDGKRSMKADGEPIRLECWAQDGKSAPIIRTAIENELKQGMMIWIREDESRFFLIQNRPQKQPNCWKAVGTPCNAKITVFCIKPDDVNVDGYLLEEGGRVDYIWNFPCVWEQSISTTNANGAPGLIPQRETVFTIQQNPATATIQIKDKVEADGHTFTITDIVKGEYGIMRLFCQSDAGGITP